MTGKCASLLHALEKYSYTIGVDISCVLGSLPKDGSAGLLALISLSRHKNDFSYIIYI